MSDGTISTAAPRTRTERTVIRQKLRERMESEDLSVFDIVREIDEVRKIIAPHIDRKLPVIAHDTISRFLVEGDESIGVNKGAGSPRKIRPKNVEIIRHYLVNCGLLNDSKLTFNRPGTDFVFMSLREFFGVNDKRLDQCKAEMPGAYQFFMKSEDWPNDVVIGALRFEIEPNTGAFAVTERQERHTGRSSTSPGAQPNIDKRTPLSVVENWRGYCFPRQGRVVIILRSNIDRVPKFYIFHTPHYTETNTVGDMQGIMIKLGTKGGGIFVSKVFLVRDEQAFNKCDVVPGSEIDKGIFDYL
jgi:hypothetical protein